jgi:hypothetical protein
MENELMSCTERDRIVLAFALAANEGNIAAEDVELASSDGERQNARQSMEAARSYCYSLRTRFLTHCEQHGC